MLVINQMIIDGCISSKLLDILCIAEYFNIQYAVCTILYFFELKAIYWEYVGIL